MKRRISLTLDENLMPSLDKLVDGLIIRSRSHAVEKILREHLLENKTAVILAGGDPNKLFIAGTDTFRPFVDIDGTLLIEYILSKFRTSGFSNIVIVGFPLIISNIY